LKTMEIKNILQKLIKFQTNSKNYDNRIREYLEDLFQIFETEIISIPGTENRSFTIKLKGKKSDKLPIGFLCHLDTVNDSTDWTSNPYDPAIRGGSIYGLGAADMKGPIAAVLCAVYESMPLNRDVFLMFTSDEETSVGDVKKIVKKINLKNSLIIAPEPTDEKILIGQRGILEIEIEMPGKSLHASSATRKTNENFNAIYKMSKVIDFIKNQEAGFEKKSLKTEEALSVINLGKIRGGSVVNAVADKCCLEVSYRLSNADKISVILREINNEIKRIDKNAKSKVLLIGNSFIGKNRKSLEGLKSIVKRSLLKASFEYGKIWSEVVEFDKNGNTCIIFGPGSSGQAHRADEYIEIDRLRKFCQIYKEILEEF